MVRRQVYQVSDIGERVGAFRGASLTEQCLAASLLTRAGIRIWAKREIPLLKLFFSSLGMGNSHLGKKVPANLLQRGGRERDLMARHFAFPPLEGDSTDWSALVSGHQGIDKHGVNCRNYEMKLLLSL